MTRPLIITAVFIKHCVAIMWQGQNPPKSPVALTPTNWIPFGKVNPISQHLNGRNSYCAILTEYCLVVSKRQPGRVKLLATSKLRWGIFSYCFCLQSKLSVLIDGFRAGFHIEMVVTKKLAQQRIQSPAGHVAYFQEDALPLQLNPLVGRRWFNG